MKEKRAHTITLYRKGSEHLKKQHEEFFDKHTTTTVQRISYLKFSELNEGTNINDFTSGVRNDFQGGIDYVDQHIQGTSVIHEQRHDEQDTADKTQELSDKIDRKQKELTPLKAKLDEGAKKFLSIILKWKWWRILLFTLAFCELAFNSQVFMMMGGNAISSMATGLLVGVGIYLYAHFVPAYVQKFGRGIMLKELAFFFLFLLPIATLFYLLADIRLDYLMAMNPEASQLYNLSPFVFTAINLFVYLICYWIVYKYKPTKQQRNRYSNYLAELKEIKRRENEILAIQKERSELEPALRKRTSERESILLLGKQLEDEIQTAYEQCLAQMKIEILIRTNGEANKLYENYSIVPLKFNYQSINLKS